MSSFMVEKSTIDRIVWGMKHINEISFGTPFEIKDLDFTGGELWHLNLRAYCHRYNEPLPEKRPYTYGGSLLFRDQSLQYKVSAFKAMECLLYQCTEGEQFENDAHFKMVEKAKERLASTIVHSLPEYEKAEWK